MSPEDTAKNLEAVLAEKHARREPVMDAFAVVERLLLDDLAEGCLDDEGAMSQFAVIDTVQQLRIMRKMRKALEGESKKDQLERLNG